MMLENKVAVIHGGGGAIGGAVARALAREGARVFLAGRTKAKLQAVAADISAAGGRAEIAEVDALDEAAVTAHADKVAAEAGGIDIALNAIGLVHVQGTPFLDLAVDDYMHPIAGYLRSLFITSKAVARHMAAKGSGVILTLSTPGSRLPWPGFIGYGVTCAAKEAFSKKLAVELGPSGIRVVCLMPNAIPEACERGSHAREVFGPVAAQQGLTVEEMLAGSAETTLLRRLPTLDHVARTAVFVASDHAGAMTGAVVNLTCGVVVD
jgi:3-oxoacyl-[acyl-carrier protein] reductase